MRTSPSRFLGRAAASILSIGLRRIGIGILLFGLLAGPVIAEEGGDPARSEIRAIIADQLDAFRLDDAPRAFSHAAPGIQRAFPTPEAFMDMVRRGYLPVYRPKEVAFGPAEEIDGTAVQQIFVTGPDGKDWVALYTLERQPDGAWKISGCLLRPAPGSAI